MRLFSDECSCFLLSLSRWNTDPGEYTGRIWLWKRSGWETARFGREEVVNKSILCYDTMWLSAGNTQEKRI